MVDICCHIRCNALPEIIFTITSSPAGRSCRAAVDIQDLARLSLMPDRHLNAGVARIKIPEQATTAQIKREEVHINCKGRSSQKKHFPFYHHLQGRIGFNTVNTSLSTGKDYPVHSLMIGGGKHFENCIGPQNTLVGPIWRCCGQKTRPPGHFWVPFQPNLVFALFTRGKWHKIGQKWQISKSA